MIATVPKKNITKLGIYVNSGRKTLAAIRQETGCTYILNGGLFNMATFQPVNHLTVGGTVLSANGNPYGYGIRGTELIFSYGNNVKAPDFLGAYPVLVRDGKATGEAAPAGLGGYRPRSAVGVKADDSVVLLCDQTNRSLDGIAGDLVAAGCVTAINLDGGGSSQCDFDGDKLTADRIVHNYLLVWCDAAPDKPDTNEKTEESDMLKVLLIAGHGAGDPGAVSGSWREADEARTIVSKLDTQLRDVCDVTVYPTDRNAYEDCKKGTLAAVAGFSAYDYVLEIHFNAFDGAPADGKTKGVECYVTTSESGVSVEEAICKNIAALGLANRGVKRKNFDVIQAAKKVGVSSALLEVCFLDDLDDMAVYAANKDAAAKAIAEGICSGFGIQMPETTEPAEPAEPAEPWYQGAMEFVVANCIADGTRPTDPATRAEVWTMLERFYKLVKGG